MAGTKINEYPQAAALNDTDLLVMDQVQSGIHSTKSVSIGQITDKATSGLSGDNIPIEAGSQDSISDVVDALNDNFADAYDPAATYNTGDVCIYNNVLYICTADNTTGTFDPSKWTATTIDNIIGDLSELTTSVTSSLVGAVNEVNAKASSGEVTLSPASGYSIIGYSNYIHDKSVALNFYMEKTGGWSTGWLVVGTVDKKPSGNVYCPLWNVTNGGANGMCRIDTNGTINFYVTTAGNVRLNANITYRTA